MRNYKNAMVTFGVNLDYTLNLLYMHTKDVHCEFLLYLVLSSQTYDSWKDKWLRFQESLPEFSWLKELKDSLPDLSNTFAGGIT